MKVLAVGVRAGYGEGSAKPLLKKVLNPQSLGPFLGLGEKE